MQIRSALLCLCLGWPLAGWGEDPPAGDVTNITKSKTAVPLIEVAVKDAGGATLYTWTTEPPRASLEPAELVRFRARLASPPEQGQSVKVRFTSAQSAANLASKH